MQLVKGGKERYLGTDWDRLSTDMGSLPVTERLTRREAEEVAQKIQSYIQVATCMACSQERMRSHVNRHRREPDFDVGDRVFIVKKSWSTDRPSDKLDFPLTRSDGGIGCSGRWGAT